MLNSRQNRSFLASAILHMVFFGLLIFFQQRPSTMESIDLNLSTTDVSQISPIAQYGAGGDFSGHNLSISTPKAQDGGGKGSEKPKDNGQGRIKKMTAGLSGLAAQMAKMNLGGLKTNIGKNTSILGADGGKFSALGKGLSMGKGTGNGLGNNYQVIGQGNIGGQMKWNILSQKESDSFSAKDQELLAETIRALQDDFRNCYENALLVDESLSVTLQMEVDIMNSGQIAPPRYNILGKSTSEGQENLSSCMTTVLKKVKFNDKLRGIKFKNEIIFKS